MDLVQLRYFTRIAALRSFNRAAAHLAVAQPALTRPVKLLEEELGVQLLLRHSRGVEPTEAGEILAHGAETILRLADTVKSDVVTRAMEPRGTVRIGFPPSLGLLMTGDLWRTSRPAFLKSSST